MAEIAHLAVARWRRASVGYVRVDPEETAEVVGVPVRRDVRLGTWMLDGNQWSNAVHGIDTAIEDEESDERMTLYVDPEGGAWRATVRGPGGVVLFDLLAQTSGHAMSLAEAGAWHILHLHPTLAAA
ncbi:hypothetical protein [Aureimonas sp. N4]|uniref:hypothetical protein n=1 Tax=Aureimonas sp. N4 TaxID=1638165 RepID=UPI0007861980|nr:hypothetical protein [Aureimonas sp. N4]